MPALTLGYVDVTTARSTSPVLVTFPLQVEIAFGSTPPWWDQPDAPSSLGPFLTFLAGNPYVVGTAGTHLYVGAAVRKSDGTGQTIELAIATATPLPDAEVIVRVNTSALTSPANYAATPSPVRGESFVIVGTRSDGLGPLPALDYVVGTTKNADPHAAFPDSATNISVRGPFQTPTAVLVGQRRIRTAAATFTQSATTYRRALGNLSDTDQAGILLDATLHDPTSTDETWLHVGITQPDAPDGPARAPVPVTDASAGAIPVGGLCTYQVSWVHGTWTGNVSEPHRESSPSPVSVPVSSPTGALAVPLPPWQDPHELSIVPPTPPEQVVAWRIYRTVTGATVGGDAYLVHEEAAPVTAAGDVVPGHTWVDTTADTALTTPLLSAVGVTFRHTTDHAALLPAGGFSALAGHLDQVSYEEDGSGTPRFRGTTYTVDLTGTPSSADIAYTTRPAAGLPRVTWVSHAANGQPHGVDTASVTITPTGVAVGDDDTIDALLQTVPADFGVDWLQRGPDRVRIEIGRSAGTGSELDVGVGLVTARVAGAGATHPRPSLRTVNVDMTPGDLSFTARHLRRLRLLFGLPRPVNPRYAVDGDGLVAEVVLDPADGDHPRSLRVRRDTAGPADDPGTSRLVLRVGALPDTTVVDLRPGNPFPTDASPAVPLSAGIEGQLRRVAALVQGRDDLARGAPTDGHRRDGAWVTLPEPAARLDLSVDSTTVHVLPSHGMRVDASLRSTAGLGSSDPFHLVQGSVSTGGEVKVRLPQTDGSTGLDAPMGVSGRVALSSRVLDGGVSDTLLAVRATPQARLALRRIPPSPDGSTDERRVVDDVTLRWLGVTGGDKPADGATPRFTGSLGVTRTNNAFRAGITLTDDRIVPSTWVLARARIADVPESVSVEAHTDTNEFKVNLNRRGGRVLLVAQPPHVPTSGWGAGSIVGVGLVQAQVDALPANLQLDLLGGTNPQQAEPFNSSPDSNWVRAGFRIQTDGQLVVRSLQIIDVAMVRPSTFPSAWYDTPLVPPTAFWSQTAASLLQIDSEDGSPPGALWIWTPHEPPPVSSRIAGDWEGLDSWIGYKIESPALVTLQIQPYEATTTDLSTWWHDGLSWLLKAEFQMQSYRGEVTVDGVFPSGDTDAGPGKWTLRVPDGVPPVGDQIVFGNTGGWAGNRPRIFAPFTPSNNVPTF